MASESAWLAESAFIDHSHPAVGEFVARALDDLSPSGPTEVAVGLFEQVRDSIRYDPYRCSRSPGEYRASHIALSQSNWCVPKSVLLCAAARSQGIPARLGFADVRNHLTTERLQAAMGTDVFMWHGYAEVLLDGRWFKLSTAFNIELCERFGVGVLHFDGTDDALMHPFDTSGRRHMEYLRDHGSFDDLPLDRILADFDRHYPGFLERVDAHDPGFSAD